jgi:hypothetical protein
MGVQKIGQVEEEEKPANIDENTNVNTKEKPKEKQENANAKQKEKPKEKPKSTVVNYVLRTIINNLKKLNLIIDNIK